MAEKRKINILIKRLPELKGRSTKTKAAVIGTLERKGKVRAKYVKDVSGKTIEKIAYTNIKWNTAIYADEFKGYRGLNKDYQHSFVIHSLGKYVINDAHTNTIGGYWSLVKRCIYGIYHNISKKHLQKYLNEFSFRYNCRALKKQRCF